VPLHAQRITYRAPGIPVRFYYYNMLPVNDRCRIKPGYVMLVMEDVTEQVRLSGHIQSIERDEWRICAAIAAARRHEGGTAVHFVAGRRFT
jgi:hypothetical protein